MAEKEINRQYIKYVDLGLDEIPVMVGMDVRLKDLVANLQGNGIGVANSFERVTCTVAEALENNLQVEGRYFKDFISKAGTNGVVIRVPRKSK